MKKSTYGFYDEILSRRLIAGERRHDKLRIFMRLCRLSQMGHCAPSVSIGMESKGAQNVPAIDRASENNVIRNKILADVRDMRERNFLMFYSEFQANILQDIDYGFLDYKKAKSILNSALIDIIHAADRRKPILSVITSVREELK